MYWVMRVSANAKEPQLVISRNTVNIRPAVLRVCTSVNPAVVIEIVVIYTASAKSKCSISIYPTMPMVTMTCKTIKGCSRRQSEFFNGNSGFGKYKERMAKLTALAGVLLLLPPFQPAQVCMFKPVFVFQSIAHHTVECAVCK